MKERGTLFQLAMVKALLADLKSQTRREVGQAVPADIRDFCSYHHPKPGHWLYGWDDKEKCLLEFAMKSPYGGPGDRLWVRETFFAWGRWETRFSAKKGRDEWHFIDMTLETGNSYLYAADGVRDTQAFIKRRSGVLPMYWKRPAIFMPRAASRITLEITGVRVERLQDISEADAIAEGCGMSCSLMDESYAPIYTYREGYKQLWETINGPNSWAENPWVWVVEFRSVKP